MEKYSKYLKKLWRPPIELKDPVGFTCLNHNEAPFSIGNNFTVNLENLNKYPEPFFLYKKLARHLGIDMNELLLTCGSEQGLRYVFDTFLDYNETIVSPSPTFGMIDVFTFYRKAHVKKLHYSSDLKISLNDIIKAIDTNTALFYLANPDNPTGASLDLQAIEAIAEYCTYSTNTFFLLDEAYYPYLALDTLGLINKYNKLIITRSFSKAWGLAGIRVGYIISNKENITLLRKQKPMDELNSISIDISLKALDSISIVEKNMEQVKKWKKIFQKKCSNMVNYIPAEGNFILLRLSDYKYQLHKLFNCKILPRTFDEACLADCIRFSIGTDEVMEKIINILY